MEGGIFYNNPMCKSNGAKTTSIYSIYTCTQLILSHMILNDLHLDSGVGCGVGLYVGCGLGLGLGLELGLGLSWSRGLSWVGGRCWLSTFHNVTTGVGRVLVKSAVFR